MGALAVALLDLGGADLADVPLVEGPLGPGVLCGDGGAAEDLDLEEGELELMGQLDAQKTLEEVEKQVFQMLREESLERPRRSSTQIVQEILTEEKRQMDTIRRRREDEQQTNTKKKLES